jgi:hypothetical protein
MKLNEEGLMVGSLPQEAGMKGIGFIDARS